ncbi:MAG: alpha-glucuronidase [Spirochaetales bacterium]|nr:alpha-glucuronidase [Spirochaetales bacterium]
MNYSHVPSPDRSHRSPSPFAPIEDGFELWLRYRPIADPARLAEYRGAVTAIMVENRGSSPTLAAAHEELAVGLSGLLGEDVPPVDVRAPVHRAGAVIAGTPESSTVVRRLGLEKKFAALGPGGFLIAAETIDDRPVIIIASTGEAGVLYGSFALLRRLQTERSLDGLQIAEKPRIGLRMLDHWEETRCYAGGNVWNWNELPGTIDPKYKVYARACASIGLNGAVLNNVNAEKKYLTPAYLLKEKAVADLFRPYGIRVFLSANFSAPITVGGLPTADPTDPAVRGWWKAKVDEIFSAIPDFGGFVVKANSEGEPGPKDFRRSHAEGANLLARALAPHGGIVLWRAFVYDPEADSDRLKRAYNEFTPLDGEFDENVTVQVKNGPLDFQPREPFNPLFGKMPRTSLAMELQITQEYTGQDVQLVYLAPMWKEALDADTGGGFSVAGVVDGSAHGYKRTVVAGVANTGSARNWTGQDFAQANWYAFGRLAWDHTLSAEALAEEWTRMTWGNDERVVAAITAMMSGSREACVDYMDPLGLGHLMARDHHYGPEPGDTVPGHEDWSPTYFHRADEKGLGYDRSSRGSNLVGQYFPKVGNVFDDIDACPENLLCWFHHVPWDRKMKSGRTFWEELCFLYHRGVAYVTAMRAQWDSLKGVIDAGRFAAVAAKLRRHEADAAAYRNVCLSYFQAFSRRPIPVTSP